MFKKLLTLYPNAALFSELPNLSAHEFYIFYDVLQREWLGIPRNELSDKELAILKTLYELKEELPGYGLPLSSQSWYNFLFFNGDIPQHPHGNPLRFIQFHIEGKPVDQEELESAIKGFCSDKSIILWEDANNGLIIEDKDQLSLPEKEFESMSETLESDFYIKICFYVGKFHEFEIDIREKFLHEREYFRFGQNTHGKIRIFTYERVFPAFLAFHLPEQIRRGLLETIFDVLKEDHEMFLTIMVFLENNLNASLTAKKLYIHRNTLQYRIDKFTERTGIQLKDFHGAFTVFLACQLFAISES